VKRAALLLLLLSACGEDSPSPTAPNGLAQASLSVVVETSPVVATGNPELPLRAEWRVVIRNDSNVGGRVVFVNSTLRDATSGAQARPRGALSLATDEIIARAGTDRLPAAGSLTVPCDLAFLLPSGGHAATLTVAVQVFDDNAHLIGTTIRTTVH